MSRDLFDCRDLIAQSISSYFELAAGIAKQVRKAVPNNLPRICVKSVEKENLCTTFYSEQIQLSIDSQAKFLDKAD